MSKETVNVHVRDVDKKAVEKLRKRAARDGRSLQSELRLAIEEAARQDAEAAWRAVNEFRERLAKSGRKFSDSTKLIRQDRDSR